MWREESLDPVATTWVVSPHQRFLWDEVVARLEAGAGAALQVGSWLRGTGLDPELASTMSSIAEASRRAWSDGHPRHTRWTPAAREQATRPVIASWRARRFAGLDVVDVTAGCGGDSLALRDVANSLVASDLEAARIPLLRHNLGSAVPVIRADALRPSWRTRPVLADPGRRVAGRRLRRLAALIPSVPALLAVAPTAGVVLPPALDLRDPDLPPNAELEFVADRGALVEATLWAGDLVTGRRRASDAGLGLTISGDPDEVRLPVSGIPAVGAWLVEPAPALVRSRLVGLVGAGLGWARVDERRAVLTSSDPRTSPWAHHARVLAVTTTRPAALRPAIRGLDPTAVEFLTHGVEVDLVQFRRQVGSPPTGAHGLRVHLIRTSEGAAAVVTGPRAD